MQALRWQLLHTHTHSYRPSETCGKGTFTPFQATTTNCKAQYPSLLADDAVHDDTRWSCSRVPHPPTCDCTATLPAAARSTTTTTCCCCCSCPATTSTCCCRRAPQLLADSTTAGGHTPHVIAQHSMTQHSAEVQNTHKKECDKAFETGLLQETDACGSPSCTHTYASHRAPTKQKHTHAHTHTRPCRQHTATPKQHMCDVTAP